MLAGEIARLEAELQNAKLKSKQHHFNQELQVVENVLDKDEFMVIQDLINDAGEEEYIEYTETSYEEFEEEESYEEVEEYEDDEVLEEEIIEEEIIEDEPTQPVVTSRPFRTAAVVPAKPLATENIQAAQQNLRRTPWRQKQEEQAKERQVVQAPPKPVELAEAPGPRVKKKVRPPPGKGGKPAPRVDPVEKPKPKKANPLSRLIKRNAGAAAERAKAPAPAVAKTPAINKPITKKLVTKKVVKKVVKKGAAGNAEAGGPFKRRPIPNVQPSPAGEETIFEQLLGSKLITNPKLHKCSTNGCVKDQELICLYFAASWKSECKKFNALLKEFYYNTAQQNNLEVVYVSADRSLMEFKDCFLTMPFLAMPAGTTTYKNHLTKSLKINEMPAFIVLDDEGSVVTVEGVQKIKELTKGDIKQANALADRWKKTRPIPISEVQMDKTLLHGTMDRGTIYWS